MALNRLRVLPALAACLFAAALAWGAVFWRAPQATVGAPPPPLAVATERPDPLAALPATLAALLTSPRADAPAVFVYLPWIDPDTFCRSFERLNLGGIALYRDEPPQEGWTCVTDLYKPKDGEDASVSSMFLSARGFTPNRLDIIRIKLNLLDPTTEADTARMAGITLANLFAQFRWALPEPVATAIRTLREGRFQDKGVTYDMRREFGSAVRLNVIVTFRRGLAPGGADRFRPVVSSRD